LLELLSDSLLSLFAGGGGKSHFTSETKDLARSIRLFVKGIFSDKGLTTLNRLRFSTRGLLDLLMSRSSLFSHSLLLKSLFFSLWLFTFFILLSGSRFISFPLGFLLESPLLSSLTLSLLLSSPFFSFLLLLLSDHFLLLFLELYLFTFGLLLFSLDSFDLFLDSFLFCLLLDLVSFSKSLFDLLN
jgi:hypothetical protein